MATFKLHRTHFRQAFGIAIALGVVSISAPSFAMPMPSCGCPGTPAPLRVDDLEVELQSPPVGENSEQWGTWKRWDQLVTEPFMLGVSNVDYGGLMDMEYYAFGSVGDENNARKRSTYWYRVNRDRRTTDLGTYGTAEVVHFVNGEIKGSMSVNILFDEPEVQTKR